MTNDLLLLWLTALPLMASPGPATLSLAGVGTAYGFRRGLPYWAGIVLGTWAILVLVASGATALILAEPALVVLLTVAAAAYILYLAFKIATAPVGSRKAGDETAPAFAPGLILALANPKAYAAIGAVFTSHTLIAGDAFADAAAKIAALGLAVVVFATVWLAFGSVFSRFLADPTLGRIVNIAFAAMLLVSVAFAVIGM
ncbi:threonine/homoserine/homoserine lactone efflux protein [Rhodobium orientis]|uniref:Amino acid efflux protein n=1 Tax=Rhodobium orientis TaxID=34017 RepID=A0A327JWU9_9HYPH|nr:LysE family transporter [Rhodobium orientis]MBB4301186.1 threonine/homoserine/homoserine lactone efflux protein [Rhodobium orientis]MBK5951221.1 amino acid efflux protein [Rhodobium orientis]RAI30044.1 amino acid efflux protein [Rhodobium orientis]